MEVGRLSVAAVPGVRALPALVTLPVSVRGSLSRLAAAQPPGGSPSRRELSAALAGCSPRRRRQALAWLLQGNLTIPEPVDLRAGLVAARDWTAFRPEPGSPWIIDYLVPDQVERLGAARYCRRLPDGSAVPLGRRGWQFSHNELRRYLLIRDGQTCSLCGKPIHHQPTVEHLVPQALGSLWADCDPMPPERCLWTMAPAHRACNEQRGCTPRLPDRDSPQLRLSRLALARVLPHGVASPQEVAGFLQLSRLVAPDHRKAVWRYLRHRLAAAPQVRAYMYAGRLLAYRGGRVIALPPALRAPQTARWLRARLRAGEAPVPHAVVALGQLPPSRWAEARTRLRWE